jgi:hypothetical protein
VGEVRPIPTLGGVVRDVRGRGRALRVSWHAEDGLVVLSLWDGGRCTGTVRVAAADVPALVEALQLGLRPPVLGPPPEPIAPLPPDESGPVPGLDLVTGPAGHGPGDVGEPDVITGPGNREAEPGSRDAGTGDRKTGPADRKAGPGSPDAGPGNRDAGPEGGVAG